MSPFTTGRLHIKLMPRISTHGIGCGHVRAYVTYLGCAFGEFWFSVVLLVLVHNDEWLVCSV